MADLLINNIVLPPKKVYEARILKPGDNDYNHYSKGFKIFGPNFTCRKFKYNLASINICDGELEVCKNGFHYCLTPMECLEYYGLGSMFCYAEVQAVGDIHVFKDKIATDKLIITKVLSCDTFAKRCNGTFDTDNKHVTYINGIKHGEYIKKTCNEIIICNYDHGLMHGKYVKLINDVVTSERIYIKGELMNIKEYFPNGNLRYEKNYKDNMYNGVTIYGDINGNIVYKVLYKNNNLNGFYKKYYNNVLIKDVLYVNNVLHGHQKFYYPTGVLEAEYETHNGMLDGFYKTYYPNGRIKMRSTYRDQALHGPYIEYDINAKMTKIATYINNVELNANVRPPSTF